jgi:hypothetical protein
VTICKEDRFISVAVTPEKNHSALKDVRRVIAAKIEA